MSPLRVVLAVVLAAALSVAAAPVVHHARTANAASGGAVAADGVRDAVVALAASTPAPPGTPPAERTVRVSLPARDVATADCTLFVGTIPSAPDANATDTPTTDVLVVRAGERSRAFRLPVDLRVIVNGTPAPDRTGLRVPANARLIFQYVRRRGRPTVVVAPTAGTEVYTPERHHRAHDAPRLPDNQ